MRRSIGRSGYILAALLTIIIGLLTRQLSFIPLWIGDGLYAVMIYCWMRVLLLHKNPYTSGITALIWCYAVECSQLSDAPALMTMRQHTLGRLVLGQGFLWSDLLAYSAGIFLIGTADLWHRRMVQKER